jgi:acetyltransferase-like isoleucine patch superfamily enzyme
MSMKKPHMSSEGPFYWIARTFRKMHSLYLKWTYPFASVGHHFSAHPSCDIRRSVSGFMKIGDFVLLEKNVRLDVPVDPTGEELVILIGDRCAFGQRATILAINRVEIRNNSIFAPSVLITDHKHEFEDVTIPIRDQGGSKGGTVVVEEGCWIGFGTAIVSTEGELVIGKNSVVGANSLVTRSIPPYSVVTGNPARVVKHFDLEKEEWVLGSVSMQTPKK